MGNTSFEYYCFISPNIYQSVERRVAFPRTSGQMPRTSGSSNWPKVMTDLNWSGIGPWTLWGVQSLIVNSGSVLQAICLTDMTRTHWDNLTEQLNRDKDGDKQEQEKDICKGSAQDRKWVGREKILPLQGHYIQPETRGVISTPHIFRYHGFQKEMWFYFFFYSTIQSYFIQSLHPFFLVIASLHI